MNVRRGIRVSLFAWAALALLMPSLAADSSSFGKGNREAIDSSLNRHAAEPADRYPTIVDIAIDTPELSTLVAAVIKADLVDTLSAPISLTVFAPTNAAFAAAGIDPANVDAETLRAVLLDHVTTGEFDISYVRRQARSAARIPTLGGLDLAGSVHPLAVNGQNVIAKNIEASNGIIHLIDGVLLRPAPSIADAAIGTPALSTLVAAVVKAGLVETLDEAGPFTVFAPTNEAFAAAGIDPDAVDVETLTAVLLDHVVPGTFSEAQLRDLLATGGKLTTLGGLTLEFDEARHSRPFERAGATIFGLRPLEVNDLLVQATNIGTSNGNVFVINGVLLR